MSLGAQKNFSHFTLRLKERGQLEAGITYFEHLIAKAILFKRAEQIVASLNYGGYRANIVTYSLAWLSHLTTQHIDLNSIWKKQDITSALEEALRLVSKIAHAVITTPPNAGNITEWCKRKECWETLCQLFKRTYSS